MFIVISINVCVAEDYKEFNIDQHNSKFISIFSTSNQSITVKTLSRGKKPLWPILLLLCIQTLHKEKN